MACACKFLQSTQLVDETVFKVITVVVYWSLSPILRGSVLLSKRFKDVQKYVSY